MAEANIDLQTTVLITHAGCAARKKLGLALCVKQECVSTLMMVYFT